VTKILLVDDVSEVHEMVRVCLKNIEDRQIVDAFSADDAMRALTAPGPLTDVILLDIEMPGVNGLELCRQIRARQEYEKTPIIFLTQHDDLEYQRQALALGANGFVVKSLARSLVAAAVQNALKTKGLSDAVDRLIEHKTSLTNMLVHDINNALGTIFLNVDLGAVEHGDETLHRRLLTIKRQMLEIKKLTQGLLDIEKLESKTFPMNLQTVDAGKILFERAGGVSSMTSTRRLSLKLLTPQLHAPVRADAQVLGRIFDNLLQNAAKFAPEGTTVDLGMFRSPGLWEFVIENEGDAIEARFHEKIFEKFGQLETRTALPQKGVGLGLAFCRLGAQAMSGAIRVESPARWENGVGSGVRFVLSLPGAA